MLGGVFALIAAVTFAWTNAAVRRGVVTGTAVQATTLSIPIGVPLFFVALLLSGQPARLWELPVRSAVVFVIVGINHFIIGRYCNYRSLAAIGTNLAGPVMQFSLIVSLVLAIVFLGEYLTPLKILGIILMFASWPFFPKFFARRWFETADPDVLVADAAHKVSPDAVT